MSSTAKFFWDEDFPAGEKKKSEIITEKDCLRTLNRLLLKYRNSEEDVESIQAVQQYIRNSKL